MAFVWEQRKLGELLEDLYNGQTPSRFHEEFWKGDINWLSSGELNHGIITDTVEKITCDGQKDANLRIVPKGTFVMAITGLEAAGTRGNCAILGINTTVNQSCMALFPKGKLLNSEFLFHWYHLVGELYGIRYTQGTKQQSYNAEIIKNLDITLPKIEEQKKISKYFSNLDNLITLHQRKRVLYKHFLTIDWEQRKLSEIATMHARIGWQNLRTSEFLDTGNYMLITGTDFDDGSINYSTCHYVNKERYEQDKHIQIKNGSILITKDGTLGKVAYVQGLSMPATLNAGIFHIEIKDEQEIDNKYLFQYLKAPFLMDYVGKKATGGTIKHLNQNILVDFPVLMPSKLEQAKIGQYFSNFDQLITLHQWKCTIYEKIKVNAWEQRKLENITFPAGKKNKNNLPYESYSVTNESGFIPQNEQFENGGTMATADKSMYYIVSQNSFAYNPARINIGSIGYYDKPKNVIVSSLYEVFKTTDDIDDRFLWHWFKGEDFQKMIERYQEGGVRLYFYYDKLCMCRLLVPSIQEQRKIGKQLDTLDQLITLHQWECTIYEIIVVNDKNQRKSLEKLIILENNVFLIGDLSFEQGVISKFYYKNNLLRFNGVIEIKVELLFIIANKSRDVIDDVEEEIVILCKVCFNIIIYSDITFEVYFDQILLHIQEIKITFILRMLFIDIIYLKLTTKQVSIDKYFFIFDYIFILYY